MNELNLLPLRCTTPTEWARAVLKEPVQLLSDHAHLEKNAAANALALLQRWPDSSEVPHAWIKAMTRIAKEESQHLSIVTKLLEKRGSHLQKGHRNPYARALRELVRNGEGDFELIDRLLISALIELRSCERFALLADVADDEELSGLYGGLWRSEMGHYEEFVHIAEQFFDDHNVEARWNELLRREADIIKQQAFWYGMHSWLDLNTP